MDVLISLIVVTFHMYVSNHHIVHIKYVQILFVNYTSIKWGESINKYRQRERKEKQTPKKQAWRRGLGGEI